MERTMHKLSGDTVRLISSAQVITSVASVVKELVENSLDAHADNVEVKLENYGMDKVEVRDNGDGIPTEDTDVMGQRHFTSKISSHAELESLLTYGFRGEALGSLCAVSNVVIATRTRDEEVGRCYILNQEGKVMSTKPSHCGTGTTVTATKLFHNVPVRKQYYSTVKRRRDELKRVEDLLLSFGVIATATRFSLSHNKCPIWQKNKAADLRSALLNTVGSSVLNQLEWVERSDSEAQVKVVGYLPKLNSDPQLTTRTTDDRSWTSVNGRPVIMKDIGKVVKQYYSQWHPKAGNVRHVVMCLIITMPTNLVDVNLEPNKTKVLLHNKDAVLSLVIQILEALYNPSTPTEDPVSTEQTPNQPAHCLQAGHTTTATTELTLEQPGMESTTANKIAKDSDSKAQSSADDRNPTTPIKSAMDEVIEMMTPSDSMIISALEEQAAGFGNADKMADRTLEPTQPNFSLFDDEGDLFATCPNASVVPELEVANKDGSDLTKDVGDSSSGDGPVVVANSNQGSSTTGLGTSNVEKEAEQDGTDWSKGHSLFDQRGSNIQPSVLLVPGKQTSVISSSNDRPSLSRTDSNSKTYLSQPITNAASFELSNNSVDSSNRNSLQSVNGSDGGAACANYLNSANERIGNGQSANQGPEKQKSPVEKTYPGSQYDLVGKSPVQRPRGAFDFFMKETKSEVLRQHPNLDFMAVNKILKSSWDQLSDQKRAHYQELHTKDVQRYKDQVTCARLSLASNDSNHSAPVKKKKKMDIKSNQSLIDEMLASQRERNQKAAADVSVQKEKVIPARPSRTIPFSVECLKDSPMHIVDQRSAVDVPRLIGSLTGHGIWLAVQGCQLTVFNQYRAQEVVLYHRLLVNHRLPRQTLPVPVVLNSSMFGDEKNWFALLGMRSHVTPVDQSRLFNDDRLILNGFEIRQLTDPETKDARLEVVSMATEIIPFYGLDDLKEIVETIATQGSQTVAECRPLKLSNYLMGEAVRMARSLPAIMSQEEVEDILEGIRDLSSWRSKLCLHGRSFEKEIYSIPDVN